MSDIKESKSKSELEESDNIGDMIPILLLSKDLMNQLNSNSDDEDINKIKKDEKNIKDINNFINSSESSNDKKPELKTNEKEIHDNIINCDFYKLENEDKNHIPNEKKNNEIFQSKLYKSSLLYELNKQKTPKYEKNINKNYSEQDDEGEKKFLINKNNNYNYFDYINNNNFNQVYNAFYNCFTMNGKPGWICFYCKIFNYESK